MDEQTAIDLAVERYHAAAHACMTGAGYLVEKDPKVANPKHVRNGIDMRAVDTAALAGLLIEKGIITKVEYCEALANEAEAEQVRYEKTLRDLYGPDIKLL